MCPPTDTIIKVRDLYFSYKEKEIFKGLCLDIKKNEFISILGASGTGKTTLFRLLTGLEQGANGAVARLRKERRWSQEDLAMNAKVPLEVLRGIERGAVVPRGRNLTKLTDALEGSSEELKAEPILIDGELPSDFRKSGGLTYASQAPALLPWYTVRKNVELAFPLRNKELNHDLVDDVLLSVGLLKDQDKYPSELSGGMLTRANLARSWVDKESHILLLDEPFAALDAILREKLGDHLQRLKKRIDCTVLYITHDVSEAIQFSDRILLLSEGRLKEVDSEISDQEKREHILLMIKLEMVEHGQRLQDRLRFDDRKDRIESAYRQAIDPRSPRDDRLQSMNRLTDILKDLSRLAQVLGTNEEEIFNKVTDALLALWEDTEENPLTRGRVLIFRLAPFCNAAKFGQILDWAMSENYSDNNWSIFCDSVEDYLNSINKGIAEYVTDKLETYPGANEATLQFLTLAVSAEELAVSPKNADRAELEERRKLFIKEKRERGILRKIETDKGLDEESVKTAMKNFDNVLFFVQGKLWSQCGEHDPA